MSEARRGTVAFVESATQLLNVAEWAYASGVTEDVQVAVLLPRDAYTVRQIAEVTRLVRRLGMAVRPLAIRARTPGAAPAVLRAVRAMSRAERLVVGDPFSGWIQTLLPACNAAEVVVVDDGTATWEFSRCIDAGAPLIRWDASPADAAPRSVRACHLLSPSMNRQLAVFSCLVDASPLSATGLANRYEWTRAWQRPEVVDEVDVLGASLVDTGTVRRESYVAAVADLARRHTTVRYLAHRRESPSLVVEIGALRGVRVVREDLPVELSLRRGPVARRVITFPSTAAHTLPIVLGDVGVHVEVRRVDPAWFTPAATPHARQFVAKIADRAPCGNGKVLGAV